jgi:predicted naringenin-chalcone synthase
MEEKLRDYEVSYVTQQIMNYGNNYNPSVLYCLVDKRISHRIFYPEQGQMYNPGPGTCLDTGLVEN